jgi:crossover junction endodeoxyribonuclease RuvC
MSCNTFRKNFMIKIGIDPGLSGAIVIMDMNCPIEWHRMPTMKTGSANRVNAPALAAIIRPSIYGEEIKAYVELVSSMPGQGVASMFSFGHSAGVIQGVLGAFEIPVTKVTPSQWKKRAGLTGQDKDASRTLAIQMWPSWRELDKKGAGQAYADAAFIALYGD